MTTALEYLKQFAGRLGAALGFGVLGLLLGACAPQNATPEQAMYRSTSANAYAVATDVQRNNGARHYAVLECPSFNCSLVHWRKDSPTDRNVVVTTTVGSSVIEAIDVAAMDDGSAVLVWFVKRDLARTPKYAIVSDAGTVSGPFDLDTGGYQNLESSLLQQPLKVAANGTAAFAVYLTGNGATMRLWYRQLLPALSNSIQIQAVESFALNGYLSNPTVALDPVGNAHVTWRYVAVGGFSAVGYARVTTPGVAPAVVEVERSGPGSGITLSAPDLVVDANTTPPRAHVAYKRVAPSASDAGIAIARYDNGVYQSTRAITLTNADGWTLGGAVEPLSVALFGTTPSAAFIARRAPVDAAFYAYLWKGTGVPQRVSFVGGISSRDVRLASLNEVAPQPMVAYKVVSATTGASGVFVFDSVFSRTVTVANDPFCSGGFCQDGFDVAAHADTMTVVWLAKKDGTSVFRAYESRNDTTPQGVLKVTTLADNNLPDNHLSLREAMLVANGTLTHTFSTLERGLLTEGGCIFNGSGAIIGGCGANITDTVSITPGLVGTITLAAVLPPLPPISDTRPMYLTGASGRGGAFGEGDVIVDGRYTWGGNPAIFEVRSNGNQISEWNVINAQRGIHVKGNDNRLAMITAFSHTVAAIDIEAGDRNRVFVAITAPGRGESGCIHGANGVGLLIHSGAQRNTIASSLLTCASQYGLIIDGAETVSNTFGGVFVGAVAPGLPGNAQGGALLRNGANNNHFTDAPLFANAGPGLTIRNANQNVINGGGAISNTGPGIRIEGTSAGNVFSGTILAGQSVGIEQAPGAGANFWSRVAMYGSTPPRIDIATPGAADPPSIVFGGYNPASGAISGTLTYPGPALAAVVDLYAVIPGFGGYPHAAIWQGQAVTTSSGAWAGSLTGGHPCVLAVVSLASGSSEFSELYCRHVVLLPHVMR